MSSKYPEIRTVAVRIFTDKPVRKTPYQVKGVMMNQFPDEEIVPMLDGSYRQKFLYPRVQVKILNEQIYIVGINEGVDSIKAIAKKMDFWILVILRFKFWIMKLKSIRIDFNQFLN